MMRRIVTTSAKPVGEPGVGGQPVATGATGLLIVGLDALRQVQVGDKAHVRLIDAHAEGDGGDDDDALAAQELGLVGAAHVGRQAGMIGQRVEALALQEGRGVVHLLAREAVDDTGVARVLGAQELEQLLPRLAFSTMR
jgi:hypothetical protein